MSDLHRGTEAADVGINIFTGYNMIEWQYLFAGSIFAVIPVVILFMSIEKHLVPALPPAASRAEFDPPAISQRFNTPFQRKGRPFAMQGGVLLLLSGRGIVFYPEK